ncbi:hypothetical protein ACAH01_02145 [Halomicrobium sp. HM KBTZ05]|uniref:hypothetical protein n=1 Tax=Halomicrobium sp. HM KBTZ05 TaxID=3242663 RepID=UPI0035561F42
MADEFREQLATTVVEEGAFHEYCGDFQILGELDDNRSRYDDALQAYRDYERETTVSQRIGQLSEPIFKENTKLLRNLHSMAGVALEDDLLTKIEFQSPVERVEYKRKQLPNLIKDAIESST